MPSLRTLVSDERGQLWVESWSRSGFNVSVIDAQGRLVGEAPMPRRDPRIAPFVRNNLLYIVTKDSDDVQSIAVYALTR
jgi:sugar lactone lactonase YvrE